MSSIGQALAESVHGKSLRERIPAYTVGLHADAERHLLLWQVFGESDVTVGREQHLLAADRAVWVPVGTKHSFTNRRDSVILPAFFRARTTVTTLDKPVLLDVDSALARLLLADLQSQYTIIRPELDVTRQIISRIEQRPGSADRESPPAPLTGPARTIARALIMDPGDGRSIPELAASVHVSARSIERAFRAETGMTLSRWRRAVRMRTAARLLMASTTVDAVAQRVGYSSTNAFRRAFADHHGVSPGVYADHRHGPR